MDIERELESLGFNGAEPNLRCLVVTVVPPTVAYKRILRILVDAILLRPRAAKLWALKGKVLTNLGLLPAARKSLEKAVELEPGLVDGHVWLGEARLLEGLCAESLVSLNCALKLSPGCPWALFFRAACHVAEGREKQARADLRRAIAEGDPAGAASAARACLGLLDAQAGNFLTALAYLKPVVSRWKHRSWPYALRGRVRRLMGEYDGAWLDMRSAFARGATGWMYGERALLNEAAGRMREAFDDYERVSSGLARSFVFHLAGKAQVRLELLTAVRLARKLSVRLNKDAELWFLIGGLESRLGNRARALAAYTRAESVLGKASAGDALRKNLCLARRDLELNEEERITQAVLCGRFAQAERLGEKLLDGPRKSEQLECLRRHAGTVSSKLRQAPSARRRSLRKALRSFCARRPTSAWALFYRYVLAEERQSEAHNRLRIDLLDLPVARYGALHYVAVEDFLGAGKTREALKLFELIAATYDPPDWHSYCRISEALLCLGEHRRAWKTLALAQAFVPAANRPAFMAWKGELLLWMGRYREALAALEPAAAADAGLAHCWHGGTLIKLGRSREALEPLTRALDLVPSDPEAMIWMAEALYRLGDYRGALAKLDQLAEGPYGEGLYAFAIRGLADAALGDIDGLYKQAEKAAAWGNPYGNAYDYVAQRLGIVGSSTRKLRRIFEGILEFSRGVRREGHEMGIWQLER